MDITKELLEKRIAELEQQYETLVTEANACAGAGQEAKRMLAYLVAEPPAKEEEKK